jgi:tRNA1Val (adenine37-N6)-methyltransferase
MFFKLKHFNLKQTDSLQKMGSDTMLLGATLEGDYKNILDIGTGTGILALMMAQKNKTAQIIAIEPHLLSCQEAEFNFKQSKFKHQLTAINTTLQNYKSQTLFDLIITNPPYYHQSTLGKNQNRNTARHTINLSISDLYSHTANLLTDNGKFHLIFPTDLFSLHIEAAKTNHLYPNTIWNVTKENGKPIRSIITYTKHKQLQIQTKDIIISLSNGKYSQPYIELTKDFYAHDLSKK